MLPFFLFLLHYPNQGGNTRILPLVLLVVFSMCVEGSLDLLYCLFYVAAAEVQVLDPLSEIMIASGRI